MTVVSVQTEITDTLKRTERLDREKEIALPMVGKDVFASAGDLMLTQEEKEQLSSNLRAMPYQQLISEMAKEVALDAANFIQTHLFHYAKARKHHNVVERIVCNDLPAIDGWLGEQGFEFIVDGLTTVIRKKGKVWRKYTYSVDHRFAADVIKELNAIRAGGPAPNPPSS